jgi:hypothetical protein
MQFGKYLVFQLYMSSLIPAFRFVKLFRDDDGSLVSASSIIRSLGSFDNLSFDPTLLRCPARYGARISLAFTSTDATIVEVEELFNIDDISTPDNKYCFTDGVGTMSKQLADDIWTDLKAKKRRSKKVKQSSSLQIRFRGSKGMLSVDYKLSGLAVCLRPSMIKFETPESRQLEIARVFDRPGPYYLNRPLIMLLEDLGVPYEVFKKYQDDAVREVRAASDSVNSAARMLESHGLGTSYRLTSVMLSLGRIGIDNLPSNQFYQKMLRFAIHHVLRLLKNHARIPIPHAWTLVGVADIHKYLEPDEIFACIKPLDGPTIYLEGPVLVSRSPTIHPGDVQIAQAIGKPPRGTCFSREPLHNTVVFSVKGAFN